MLPIYFMYNILIPKLILPIYDEFDQNMVECT